MAGSRACRGRDALLRVRRRTSGSRSILYAYSPPLFVRLFTFYGHATPDARERVPTVPFGHQPIHLPNRRSRGSATLPDIFFEPRGIKVVLAFILVQPRLAFV